MIIDTLPKPLNSIIIENKKGEYKDFGLDKNTKYPLQGVEYPVDYGYLPGYIGEDNHELDFFVGRSTTLHKMGYIIVSRPESNILEHKFFVSLTNDELEKVLKTFQVVLKNQAIFTNIKVFLDTLEAFKINRQK